MPRDPYVDPQTGLNNVDNILEDARSGRYSYDDEDEDEILDD
jgi:hypothetical protein